MAVGSATADQSTFADLEYQGKKRKTRRELFLERMDGLIPWQKLEERIRPVYPKAGQGRHPYPLAVMLRVHCVQLFYNLSDPGMEDLLYESDPVRRFVGLRLTGPLPDETTIVHFRHLLEKHSLGQGFLEEINTHLDSQGLKLREGTIVDASIIEAPSSTKNRTRERDPDMHQTKKGKQLSRVNYICRLASISFAGSPPRPGRVAGQRCRPPLIHVQVRATDTRGSDLHDAIVGVLQLRVWHIFRGDTEWGLVNNCFHNKPLLGLQGSSIVGLL